MSCIREIGYVTRYEEIIEDDCVKVIFFIFWYIVFEKIKVENLLNKYPHSIIYLKLNIQIFICIQFFREQFFIKKVINKIKL